jgi:hypothetical protein
MYNVGSAATALLAHAFCSTNSILNTIAYNSTLACISTSVVQSNLQAIDAANKVYFDFMPSKTIMEQIETFNSLRTLNLGQLIENEPKLLIASRLNSDSNFFYKGIAEYREGFTDGQSNFWIGLETLHQITHAHDYKLRIVATTPPPSSVDFVEEYLVFKVGSEKDNFALNVSGLVLGSNAYFAKNNGLGFSTFDYGNINLGQEYSAGYWLKANNEYCFSCLGKMYESGSSVNVWLSEGNFD